MGMPFSGREEDEAVILSAQNRAALDVGEDQLLPEERLMLTGAARNAAEAQARGVG